jgi:AbrB family looped-hinge helix DNA binding protein
MRQLPAWGGSKIALHSRKTKGFMDSALTAKGQVTIPKAVRDHLNLSPGDRVKFFLHLDGTVVILPSYPPPLLRIFCRLARGGHPPSQKCRQPQPTPLLLKCSARNADDWTRHKYSRSLLCSGMTPCNHGKLAKASNIGSPNRSQALSAW